MKRLSIFLLLLAMLTVAQAACAKADPWKARLAVGMAECKRLYAGPPLKACIVQVREIIRVTRHPPRAKPGALIRPNALYGLP